MTSIQIRRDEESDKRGATFGDVREFVVIVVMGDYRECKMVVEGDMLHLLGKMSELREWLRVRLLKGEQSAVHEPDN